jgi:plastocyanin
MTSIRGTVPMRPRSDRWRAVWVALLLVAAGPGRATAADTAPDTDAAGASIVLAREFMFAPGSLTIDAGSTVTWTNKDEEPHTVVSDSGLFRSGAMDTNQSFSFRFDKPGTYRFFCSIHPRMVGTILVR